MTEETVWSGNPSQLVNFWSYLVSFIVLIVLMAVAFVSSFLLFPLVLLPIGYAFWKWLTVRCEKYELTTERFRVSRGVFTVRREELELYRVKDTSMEQPFVMRLFSLGNLILATSDRSDPEFVVPAVRNPSEIHDQVRKYSEIRRDLKRVREVDFE